MTYLENIKKRESYQNVSGVIIQILNIIFRTFL